MFRRKSHWETSITMSKQLLKLFKVYREKNTNFPSQYKNLEKFNEKVVDKILFSLYSYLYRTRNLSNADVLLFKRMYPLVAFEYDKHAYQKGDKKTAFKYETLLKEEQEGFTTLGKCWKQFFM